MGRTIEGALSDDGRTATLTVSDEGGRAVALALDGDGLVALIERLGQLRAAMEPAIPSIYDLRGPGGGSVQLVDPAMRMQGETVDGRRMLAFRSPGYGWIALLIGSDRTDALATSLAATAEGSSPA